MNLMEWMSRYTVFPGCKRVLGRRDWRLRFAGKIEHCTLSVDGKLHTEFVVWRHSGCEDSQLHLQLIQYSLTQDTYTLPSQTDTLTQTHMCTHTLYRHMSSLLSFSSESKQAQIQKGKENTHTTFLLHSSLPYCFSVQRKLDTSCAFVIRFNARLLTDGLPPRGQTWLTWSRFRVTAADS